MINIIQNFLDQETINFVMQKYENARGRPQFEINEMGRWQENLYAGNYGPVYILPLYEELSSYFDDKLSKISEFSEYNTKTNACFLHIWQPGSAINWHHDSVGERSRIGMTIYLNEEWSVNWGGLFLWEQNGQTGWYCPQYNSAVWLLSPLWHSVTMINRSAPKPRLSLQLFLEKL